MLTFNRIFSFKFNMLQLQNFKSLIRLGSSFLQKIRFEKFPNSLLICLKRFIAEIRESKIVDEGNVA